MRGIATSFATALTAFFVNTAEAQESNGCAPNQYFDYGRDYDVSATEFVMSTKEYDCPPSDVRGQRAFSLTPGREVYFWMRLQGTTEYAASQRAQKNVHLIISRIDQGKYFYDAISLGAIDTDAALVEARGAGGRFDWRMGGWKAFFLKPGDYEASIRQGQTPVCISEPSARNCAYLFSVQ